MDSLITKFEERPMSRMRFTIFITVSIAALVLAPGTIQDCFWLTVKAFNLAERYQLPVVLLTDQHLASSYSTIDKFDLSRVTIDRGASLQN